MTDKKYTLGIDIGSTTVKIAVLDQKDHLLFSDYERHFANIRETLSGLLKKAYDKLGQIMLSPMITGSGGLTLAKHLEVPFVHWDLWVRFARHSTITAVQQKTSMFKVPLEAEKRLSRSEAMLQARNMLLKKWEMISVESTAARFLETQWSLEEGEKETVPR